MTDNTRDTGGPLFKDMDEKERIYAPQQVPADARAAADEGGADLDREAVVGSEGQYAAPVIPAQSTIGSSANMPVPVTAQPDLITERERRDDERE